MKYYETLSRLNIDEDDLRNVLKDIDLLVQVQVLPVAKSSFFDYLRVMLSTEMQSTISKETSAKTKAQFIWLQVNDLIAIKTFIYTPDWDRIYRFYYRPKLFDAFLNLYRDSEKVQNQIATFTRIKKIGSVGIPNNFIQNILQGSIQPHDYGVWFDPEHLKFVQVYKDPDTGLYHYIVVRNSEPGVPLSREIAENVQFKAESVCDFKESYSFLIPPARAELRPYSNLAKLKLLLGITL